MNADINKERVPECMCDGKMCEVKPRRRSVIREYWSKVRVWGVAGIINFLKRKHVYSVQGRRLAKLASRAIERKPDRGITIIGDLTGMVSLSKATRDFILCLRDANIPFQTYDTLLKPEIPECDVRGIVTPSNEFDLNKYSHIVMMYRSPLDERLVPDKTCARVAFYDGIHGIHEQLPFLQESGDEIIAMSDFNYEYFRREFPNQRVWKVVYPFRFRLKGATSREELRTRYGIGKDDFVVFFNFDFGSYYRKNIPAALRSFSLAFKGDRTAKLLFKTKGARANRRELVAMEREVAELGIGDQFIHISQYLPRADVDGLTGACDVYLSLHKCEGFGLGMAEAMSQGKPVVATNWSANTEFCRSDTAWCIPYHMVPVLPHEYPVSIKEWADADVTAAASALREIRSCPDAASTRAERGRVFIREHFSIDNFKKSVEAFLDK